MLNSEPKASGNRNIMKFAGATAAMALLAGCAVAVPLPPLTTFSQDSRHLVCTGSSKCRNGNQVAYRRSQPVGVSKIDDEGTAVSVLRISVEARGWKATTLVE